MNYCVPDFLRLRYYCDWNNTYYLSYQQCYNNCYISLAGSKLHISQVDFTFWSVGFAMFFALFVLAFMLNVIKHD